MPARNILMGVVGRPHGVRGLLHVHSYAADPAGLAAYKLHDERGRDFRLRWQSDGIAEVFEVVDGKRLKVADRTAAEKLVNLRLFVERDRLPTPDEDEFYLADLVGLTAITPCTTTAPARRWKSARSCCRSPAPACRKWTSPADG